MAHLSPSTKSCAINVSVTINASGNVVFTPTPGFSGIGSFSYTVSDGSTTTIATVTITVIDPPLTLQGTTKNDTLTGKSGNDQLYGNAGNDTYIIDSTSDTIIELAGEGTDTVKSFVSWTLGDNLENLTLTESSSINGTGNSLDNTLTIFPSALD
jgi:Ca2+-binding RTX toxin-like protein